MTLPIGVRAGMVDQLISIMISIMINNFLKMKCYLFNDPFNKYGQETAVGNKCRGHETMKYGRSDYPTWLPDYFAHKIQTLKK